jgi:group II intron reverse transcriptase/maturase
MQTTQYRGYPQEVGVEPRGNEEVHSISPASESRRGGGKGDTSRLLERILDRDNLNQAYLRVRRNKGSHGVDGMEVDELLPFLKQHGETIRQSILEGTYRPSPVRRVEIPKPGGGVRQLGIPTVLDRMIQQAIAQVLTPIFDIGFSESSYGFRPGRSAKQAVIAAKSYIEQGYTWVVDIDLEKYFDTVNHDKLMALVARKIKDKRVLKLIRMYLNSGVMIGGVVAETYRGCPQGGPLSPLLSNIMLDELDKELEKRGHHFCRYADDCNIYVKSRKAAERVMESITNFLENKLKLKVNRDKSAIDRPWRRKFLGFSFYTHKSGIGIRVHPKAVKRFKDKVREITSRSNGRSMDYRIEKLRQLITGWVNYFGIADMKELARDLDKWIRRRIRMCFWKQWKKIKTKHDNLVKLGMKDNEAWKFANTRKGYWRISNSQILNKTLTKEYLEKLGLASLAQRYSLVH